MCPSEEEELRSHQIAVLVGEAMTEAAEAKTIESQASSLSSSIPEEEDPLQSIMESIQIIDETKMEKLPTDSWVRSNLKSLSQQEQKRKRFMEKLYAVSRQHLDEASFSELKGTVIINSVEEKTVDESATNTDNDKAKSSSSKFSWKRYIPWIQSETKAVTAKATSVVQHLLDTVECHNGRLECGACPPPPVFDINVVKEKVESRPMVDRDFTMTSTMMSDDVFDFSTAASTQAGYSASFEEELDPEERNLFSRIFGLGDDDDEEETMDTGPGPTPSAPRFSISKFRKLLEKQQEKDGAGTITTTVLSRSYSEGKESF
jgi:hypothetical protein